MIAPDGSHEYQLTPEELVREAEERGDSLAKALAYIVDEYPTEKEREEELEAIAKQASLDGAKDLWVEIEDAIDSATCALSLISDDVLIDAGMTHWEVNDLRKLLIAAKKAEPVEPAKKAA